MKEAAAEFLARKRIAVTGVSRSHREHGSNTVFRRLRDRGYEVFAVNPNIDGGCPLMFGPAADVAHKVMRVVFAGHVPRTV